MDLNLLRSFIAVADELHFGRAAKRLNLSQPPLTQHIKRLEAILGVILFERTKRSVKLTPAGTALLGQARRMLADAAMLPSIVRDVDQGRVGTVRIGFVTPAIFTPFRKLHRLGNEATGDLTFHYSEMNSIDQIEALLSDRLDIGVLHTPIDEQMLRSIRIIRRPLVVAVNETHRCAEKTTIQLEELASDTFILPERHSAPYYYDSVISACNASGFSPMALHSARHMLAMLGLVSLNLGVTIVPQWLRESRLAGVCFLDILQHTPMGELSVVWRKTTESRATLKALEAISAISDPT